MHKIATPSLHPHPPQCEITVRWKHFPSKIKYNNNNQIFVRKCQLRKKINHSLESKTFARYIPPKHSCSTVLSVMSNSSTIVSLNLNHLPLLGLVSTVPLEHQSKALLHSQAPMTYHAQTCGTYDDKRTATSRKDGLC